MPDLIRYSSLLFLDIGFRSYYQEAIAREKYRRRFSRGGEETGGQLRMTNPFWIMGGHEITVRITDTEDRRIDEKNGTGKK